MRRSLLIALSLILVAAAVDDRDEQYRLGQKQYEDSNFSEAFKTFSGLEESDAKDLLAKFNTLTCLVAQGKFKEAEEKLMAEFSTFGQESKIRAGALYNLGTALLKVADEADRNGTLAMKEGELQGAIQWLQQSLLDYPADVEAKNNLEYANKLLEKLEKEKQQQQQGGEQDQQQQKDQQGQQQDQQKQKDQQQSQKDQQKDQQQQQRQQPQPQQGQGQQERAEARQIPPDVARNLLKAAREAELRALKMLREQLNKDAKKRPGPKKDW